MLTLGPRASLLLGMLSASHTATELHRTIERAVDDDAVMDAIVDACDNGPMGGTPGLSLRSLAIGGPAEIERLLERLRDHGLADSVGDPDGERLWRRKSWDT